MVFSEAMIFALFKNGVGFRHSMSNRRAGDSAAGGGAGSLVHPTSGSWLNFSHLDQPGRRFLVGESVPSLPGNDKTLGLLLAIV